MACNFILNSQMMANEAGSSEKKGFKEGMSGEMVVDEECCSESTCLLQEASHVSSRSSQTSDQRLDALERDLHREASIQIGVTKRFFVSLALLLTLALVITPFFRPTRTVGHDGHEGSFSSEMLLSEFVFAPQVADSTTKFHSLARSMVPYWYEETVSRMPLFTPKVKPGGVYVMRKILLKTRDLLDTFSPVYPNATETSNGTNVDMWGLIRHYLNWGYVSVGEFQDLHNCHILYSQQQMEEKRNVVLQWKREFQQFRDTHPGVINFLKSPTGGTYHHKESHFFWQNAMFLPSGGDVATRSLQSLGSIQFQQAVFFLTSTYHYTSVMDEEAHVHYHSLRKQLRGIADEFELFGSIMFPLTQETLAVMHLVNRARKLLGDINDDWTAYSTYVENDEYYDEQTRLAARIEMAWNYFISEWVPETEFEGALRYLHDVLTSSSLTLERFLKRRKRHPTSHIVIGNEAGDADTIVSAIALAFIESSKETMQSTPVVSIPRVDLSTQRPEVCLLLKLAGISNAANDLFFVDGPLISKDAATARVTLVDHNVLAETFRGKNWTVVEIVDHHQDEGQYLDTCSGDARTIAFADDKALVASCCTLVSERLKQVWTPPYPPSLGILLIGVILLDSVNLAPEVGKVTQRDRDAVDDLLINTDWQSLPKESRLALGMTLFSVPDTTAFFQLLQDAKYDSSFWNSLSVRDALRLDYKEFSYEGGYFGVSTVLMPLEDFLLKHDVVVGILQYMADIGTDFLGIMFAFERDGHLVRQLAFCGAKGFPLNDVISFLLRSGYYRYTLNLEEIKDTHVHMDGGDLSVLLFDQNNIKPSRKQIGPILVEYFEEAIGGSDTDIDNA